VPLVGLRCLPTRCVVLVSNSNRNKPLWPVAFLSLGGRPSSGRIAIFSRRPPVQWSFQSNLGALHLKFDTKVVQHTCWEASTAADTAGRSVYLYVIYDSRPLWGAGPHIRPRSASGFARVISLTLVGPPKGAAQDHPAGTASCGWAVLRPRYLVVTSGLLADPCAMESASHERCRRLGRSARWRSGKFAPSQ